MHSDPLAVPERPPIPRRGLSEAEAANYIGMSRSFLRQARMDGKRLNRTPGPRLPRSAARSSISRTISTGGWRRIVMRRRREHCKLPAQQSCGDTQLAQNASVSRKYPRLHSCIGRPVTTMRTTFCSFHLSYPVKDQSPWVHTRHTRTHGLTPKGHMAKHTT